MTREAKNPEKIKEAVKSNIYEIRSELKYTQKEFGEILGVSDRAIQNYESMDPDYSLPIEKAMLIHNKWDYSLDQIYLDFSQKKSLNSFNVDIRDFISIEGESIIFSIPDYYWEYLNESKKINESDSTPQEKKRLIKKLEAKYSNKSKSIVWKRELPISDFLSMIKFENDEFPYVGEDLTNIELTEPTEEQLKKASEFLKELTKGDHS